MDKMIIPCIYLKEGRAKTGFRASDDFELSDPVSLARRYGNEGADEVLVFDFSKGDAEHEDAIGTIREICAAAEAPVIAAGNIRRMEDVKKLIYAGCRKAVLNFEKESNRELLEEVSKKFGKEKMVVYLPAADYYNRDQEIIEAYAGILLCAPEVQEQLVHKTKLPFLLLEDGADAFAALSRDGVWAVTGLSLQSENFMELKARCIEAGVPVNTFQSKIAWSELQLNSDGLIPVVVQDYKTDEVLMLAYMNEEAFHTTLTTGKMTYWSRSRQELWTKGLTSGHLQYVKALTLDCDNDTILAKVSQIGAACHTGNRSCFFRELIHKEYDDTNPLRVFQQVYDVISDRKLHPKDGSYTNYLFDKGIDKILKKVGEESTEIVIAAKNPDKEEIKYEISDFLYHVMVLMVEKGVTWEEITRELAQR